MDEKYKKYLPIGSVVLIKNARKRIMIAGFAIRTEEKPDKVWDYIGCLYPEGIISSDKNLLFDHKDISTIYALGYCDDEHKRYINFLESRINKNNQDELNS